MGLLYEGFFCFFFCPFCGFGWLMAVVIQSNVCKCILPAGILVLALWVALVSCFSIFLCIVDYIEWKMSKHFLAIQIIFSRVL